MNNCLVLADRQPAPTNAPVDRSVLSVGWVAFFHPTLHPFVNQHCDSGYQLTSNSLACLPFIFSWLNFYLLAKLLFIA